MNQKSEMIRLMMDLRAMFPFITEMPLIEGRDAINVFASTLITLQETARYILSEADSNEKLLQWLQERFPYATISDAIKERELMQKLIETNTEASGHSVVNELNVLHKGMASRHTKQSNR